MDDLGAMLSQFLNSSEGQAQLGALASALGVQGGTPPPSAQPPPPPASSGGGQLDIAALLAGLQSQSSPAPAPQSQPAAAAGGGLDIAALLGGLQSQSPPAPQPAAPAGGGIDMAGLGQLLSSLSTPAQPSPQQGQGGGLDLSALAGMLGGGGGTGTAAQNPLPGIDLSAMMGLQKAFSAFGGDRNTALLLALKPSLSPERQKKADDAIRLLQLIKLLPLIKETGLFGDMGWLTGGDRR